ncbi:Arsb, partial [Symbiodinium sp. KB8]
MGRKGSHLQDFSLYNATYRGGVSESLAAELGCNRSIKDRAFTYLGCSADDPRSCLPDACFEEAILLRYAMKLIQNHDPSTPLFLTFSSQFVHPPLESTKSALDLEDKIQKIFASLGVEKRIPWTTTRKRVAANLLYSDLVMGKLVDALKEKGMYEDTLVVYISDNGGGTHLRAGANNYPLKGGRFNEWEGGIRTNAFISGGFVPLHHRGSSFHGVIHIADWYPTLCSLAGVSHFDEAASEANERLRQLGLPLLGPVDGRPQMEHILAGSNGRADALHLSKRSLLKWPYKLVTGKQEYSFWQGPVFPNCSSDRPAFAYVDVLGHKVRIDKNDSSYMVNAMVEDCGDGCLFNVDADPG